MTRSPHPAYLALWLLLLFAPLSALASEGGAAAEVAEEAGATDPAATEPAELTAPEEERQVATLEQKGGSLGYRFRAVDGYAGRALQYGYPHSSQTGTLFFRRLDKDQNFELEGEFLNRHEYHGDLLYDYRGDYRLHLRTESLFHNLDRALLFAPNFTFAEPGLLLDYQAVQDQAARYGVSVAQDLAAFRYRLANFPLHLNLSYWRLIREGSRQQRFGDVSFASSRNTVYAESRAVEQQTEEVSFGVDAHLGWVDLIYTFQARLFEDRLDAPVAPYAATPDRAAGLQQHNEEPDSRFLSHTVKLHSTLSDGLAGSASYSVGQRENLSRLNDTSGVKHLRQTLQNVAGDLAYTPCKEFSLALRYRRQETDHEEAAGLANSFFTTQSAPKPAVDGTRDLVIASLVFRPRLNLSVTGEYRGSFLTRDRVSSLPSAGFALPRHTDTNAGTVALHYRPTRGARVSAKYSYQSTDHPAYGSSFQLRHQAELLGTYTVSKRWGVTANLISRREWNDQVQRYLLDPDLNFLPAPVSWSRRSSANGNLAFWLTPWQRLTLAANVAHLQQSVSQEIFFSSFTPGDRAGGRFSGRANIYGLSASFVLTPRADLSFNLQQIRSSSYFNPDLVSLSGGNDTFGIREITALDTVINNLSGRGEYRFSPQLSGQLEYNLQKYDESNATQNSFNGTVHTVAMLLKAKW